MRLLGKEKWWWSIDAYGLPISGKESIYQCRRHGRFGFDPWVRKIPWRKKWQFIPAFLPGKSYGQRSLLWAIVHRVTKHQT